MYTAGGGQILRVEDLRVVFRVPRGHLRLGYRYVEAVRGAHLEVEAGSAVGVVGGSGSGKSTLLKSVLGLVKPSSGSIIFKGVDLTKVSSSKRRRLVREIGYVPQEPSRSVNPKMRVFDAVAEPLKPLKLGREEVQSRVISALSLVDLDEDVAWMYVKELSGGMVQRVAIARALVYKPSLILLDEPTSSLDVSVQAQILNLLKDLREMLGLTYVFVSHDIDVVSYISDRIAVMVGGRIVEEGPTEKVLEEPLHPYTSVLLNPEKLIGEIDVSTEYGCPIASWCPWRSEKCLRERPPRVRIESGRTAECWRYA